MKTDYVPCAPGGAVMNKLRDFFSSLTALSDWQDEVKRALTVSENNYGFKAIASSPTEPVVIKRDALILDLCTYREKKAISA